MLNPNQKHDRSIAIIIFVVTIIIICIIAFYGYLSGSWLAWDAA